MIIISAGFTVIFILSVLLFFLYRRNREAYRELVRKSQEWANVQPAIDNAGNLIRENDSNRKDENQQDTDHTPPDELSIMKDIERLMQEEKVYKKDALTIDSLANLLGYKRRHVSEAINHYTNRNFHAFINEYRIKQPPPKEVDLLEK